MNKTIPKGKKKIFHVLTFQYPPVSKQKYRDVSSTKALSSPCA